MSAWRVLACEDIEWFRDSPALPVAARGAAANLARRIGLSADRASEVALAVSEAATNLQRHAVDGSLLLRVLRGEDRAAVEFVTVDAGPGIADVSAAMADGTSTAGTLGIGLGSVSRLADVFDIHSVPGRGTVMAAQFWPSGTRPTAGAAVPVAAGITRPISGESVCGDAWAVRVDPGGGRAAGGERATARPGPAISDSPALLVVMCDGLGHGPLAARAAQSALTAFHATPARHPGEVLQAIHHALKGTRGGAVAVARIEPDEQRLLYCGIGNISGFLEDRDGRHGLLSAPGIVGHRMHTLRPFEQPLVPGGALVMHSDGLSERWSLAAIPGLLVHGPAVVAGQLLREAAIRHDDAGIVVIKGAW